MLNLKVISNVQFSCDFDCDVACDIFCHGMTSEIFYQDSEDLLQTNPTSKTASNSLGFKVFKNLISPNFRPSRVFFILRKFCADHIQFHILSVIVVYELCCN